VIGLKTAIFWQDCVPGMNLHLPILIPVTAVCISLKIATGEISLNRHREDLCGGFVCVMICVHDDLCA
jgi:hypothetical protein